MDRIFLPYTYPDGRMGIHPKRWEDTYSHDKTDREMGRILSHEELKARNYRNMAYGFWQKHFNLTPKPAKFQLIQILHTDHSEITRHTNNPDWWPPFRDCLFRVWVEPQTFYDFKSQEHKQWYILCPEDSELVLRHEMDKKGFIQPPRDPSTEKYFSLNKNINYPLAVPVECCRHFRHETHAGALPIGL